MVGGDAVFTSVLGVFRHVASLCLKCFSCFICIFQVFHMDVAKVDRDVTYIVVVARVCCRRLFPMFHLFFHTYDASVFIWMLYMFHTYVASVLYVCCVCLQLFSSVFRCFLQVFFCKCFRRTFASVSTISDVCCMCFIWMLQKRSKCCTYCGQTREVGAGRGGLRGHIGPTRVRSETDAVACACVP